MRFAMMLVVLFLVSGCSGNSEESSRRTLSQRERDSILAETKLPGSSAIKKGYALSDSAHVRADRMENLPR